jgi:uncharacterized SAM-binding protein YcdF (DUF218 family)
MTANPGICAKRIRIAVAGTVLAGAIAFGVVAFRGAGRWLVREDPVGQADAILVLSGSVPYRAEEAVQLYREGRATEIWLTRPVGPAEKMKALGVEYIGEEVYNRRILEQAGVPDASIRVLNGEIVNTQQEIQAASAEMQRERENTILIVTSPEHTRRVRTLWKILAPSSEKAIVRAAPEDPFDADRWWGNTRDALAVVREYLGLINAWAGLPVRPHRE